MSEARPVRNPRKNSSGLGRQHLFPSRHGRYSQPQPVRAGLGWQCLVLFSSRALDRYYLLPISEAPYFRPIYSCFYVFNSSHFKNFLSWILKLDSSSTLYHNQGKQQKVFLWTGRNQISKDNCSLKLNSKLSNLKLIWATLKDSNNKATAMNPEEVKKMQGVTTNYDLNHQGLQGWEQG